jgi:hypothetical protein
MSEKAKVRFSFHIEVEVEDGSEELQKAAELSAASFMELLEANMDQHIQQLRVQHPDCNFEVGQGADGEEWKNNE